jgi:hypothetical protein
MELTINKPGNERQSEGQSEFNANKGLRLNLHRDGCSNETRQKSLGRKSRRGVGGEGVDDIGAVERSISLSNRVHGPPVPVIPRCH